MGMKIIPTNNISPSKVVKGSLIQTSDPIQGSMNNPATSSITTLEGLDTDTAKTTVDRKHGTIAVDVLKVPHTLTIEEDGEKLEFNGSEDVEYKVKQYTIEPVEPADPTSVAEYAFKKEDQESSRITVPSDTKKQDKINYITLNSPGGYLDPEMLNYLISNRLNRIIYDDNYYMLSTKDNRYWRYMGQTTDPNMLNTIVVDTATGEWHYSSIGNKVLQDHIADNDRHLREGEREFWNNKLNLETDGEILEFNRN